MSVFFTSDLHIGHRKVAASRCMLNGRPAFEDLHDLPEWFGEWDVAQIDRIMAENWDAAVQPDDHVWVLGDISSGSGKGQANALAWIKARPGVKHLVAGNHDGVHPMHRDAWKWQSTYREAFASVQSAARRRIPLASGHVSAELSHFPYVGDRYEAGQEPVDRHAQWRLRDCGDWVLHGHTHSSQVLKPGVHSRQLHVGVDAWRGELVPLETIVQIIRDQESLGL